MFLAAQSEHQASGERRHRGKRRRGRLESAPRLQIERAVGDYATTLDWLHRREHALRREGRRVHRVTFRARGQRWISKIAIEQAPVGIALHA